MRFIVLIALVGMLLGVVVPASAEPASARLNVEWYTNPADPLRSYCVGDVRGVWCHVTQRWCEWSFDRWQHWKELPQCPVTPPRCADDAAVQAARASQAVLPAIIGPPRKPVPVTGNDAISKPAQPGYYRNGKPVTKDDLVDAIARVPDTTRLRRITVIGTDADRTAALRAIGKPDWATVRAYAPEDWHVTFNGFVATGSPTIYVQDPDGTVIHRQDDLDGLAVALERANPNYDPTRDPDLRKPGGGPSSSPVVPDWMQDVDWRSFGLGAAAAGVLLFLYSIVSKLKQKGDS